MTNKLYFHAIHQIKSIHYEISLSMQYVNYRSEGFCVHQHYMSQQENKIFRYAKFLFHENVLICDLVIFFFASNF